MDDKELKMVFIRLQLGHVKRMALLRAIAKKLAALKKSMAEGVFPLSRDSGNRNLAFKG